jgi:hypothetical protein
MRLEIKKTLALAEDHRSYFFALATIEEEGFLLALDHYRGRETHSTDDP